MRDVAIYTMNTSTHRIEPGESPQASDLALRRLALETGGRAFYEMDKGEITRAFAAIENEMRNRYALSYQPGDLKEDGRFRHIQIAAEKSGRRFRVHTRKETMRALRPTE